MFHSDGEFAIMRKISNGSFRFVTDDSNNILLFCRALTAEYVIMNYMYKPGIGVQYAIVRIYDRDREVIKDCKAIQVIGAGFQDTDTWYHDIDGWARDREAARAVADEDCKSLMVYKG